MTTNKLKKCPVCEKVFPKPKNLSWPGYYERKTCSTSCGARYREAEKKRKPEIIGSHIAQLMQGWRKPECAA